MNIPHSFYNSHVDTLALQVSEGESRAWISFCRFCSPACFDEAASCLHPRELDYYNALRFERRKGSYLIGRYSAKKAISALSGGKKIRDIFIQPGIFNQPVATVPTEKNIQVSISHCDNFGAALAFSEAYPMGVDIERTHAENADVLAGHMTGAEKEKINACCAAYEAGLTLAWTAKEALSKVLKTGLTAPFEIFEISKIENHGNYINCYFKNFGQYKVVSFDFYSMICSIAYPFRMELRHDFLMAPKSFPE